MSETEIEAAPTRRTRSSQREVVREPETVIEGVANSPEAVLADATEQLKAQNGKAEADARRMAREATARAEAAERELANANASRATDRATVVASALEAARSEQSAAKAQKRAARESGDFDAEVAADEQLAAATYRATQAAGELEWIKNQPRPQAQTNAPSARAQQWIAEHPAFNTDKAYKATAVGAHTAAVEAGHTAGSEAYINYIDDILNSVYGEGHGQTEAPQKRSAPVDRPSSRGDAAPPSRGANGANGFQKARTPAGELLVHKRADGSRIIKFTSADQQSAFQEFADLSKMTLAEYATAQLEIGEEMAAGGSGDWVRGDGEIYR